MELGEVFLSMLFVIVFSRNPNLSVHNKHLEGMEEMKGGRDGGN